MSSTPTNLSVPIVYHYVAHYRESVFLTLLASGKREGIAYALVADTSSNLKSLKVVDPARFEQAHGLCWVQVRNRWFPGKVLWQSGLLAYLWRASPDAIIFLGDAHFVSTWVAAIIARMRGTKVLMWTHGLVRSDRGPKGSIRRAFYSLADKLLVYGHRAKSLLEDAGLPPEKVHVIYNSLDHPRQLSVRRALLTRSPAEVRREVLGFEDGRVLIYSGRLERFKGLELLFKALSIVAPASPDIRLLCVGDGPERRDIEALATQLGVSDRVILWGACYDEEVLGKLFYLADLCVSPGPIGLLAIHSLTYGTPVLLGDQPDKHFPEFEAITIGTTGAQFETGSAASLAAELVRALERLKKPTVMEACFRAIDDRYTPEHQAAIINEVVQAVCTRPSQRDATD